MKEICAKLFNEFTRRPRTHIANDFATELVLLIANVVIWVTRVSAGRGGWEVGGLNCSK
jgi:hypothetical protein